MKPEQSLSHRASGLLGRIIQETDTAELADPSSATLLSTNLDTQNKKYNGLDDSRPENSDGYRLQTGAGIRLGSCHKIFENSESSVTALSRCPTAAVFTVNRRTFPRFEERENPCPGTPILFMSGARRVMYSLNSSPPATAPDATMGRQARVSPPQGVEPLLGGRSVPPGTRRAKDGVPDLLHVWLRPDGTQHPLGATFPPSQARIGGAAAGVKTSRPQVPLDNTGKGKGEGYSAEGETVETGRKSPASERDLCPWYRGTYAHTVAQVFSLCSKNIHIYLLYIYINDQYIYMYTYIVS
jgi:hypothetical protein